MSRRRILILIGLLVVGAAASLFAADYFSRTNKVSQVCFKKQCFKVELALTPSKWARGLMSRPSLAANAGMLFIFDKEKESSFWMKNMLVPLDIIWLNQKQEVVFISKNNQPCRESCPAVSPNKRAKYVLEISAGSVDKLDLKEGDKLEINQ